MKTASYCMVEVPREPTEEMIEAIANSIISSVTRQEIITGYVMMLAAAPSAGGEK